MNDRLVVRPRAYALNKLSPQSKGMVKIWEKLYLLLIKRAVWAKPQPL